jgi:ubiquinone/menaquinone biosynthesis C-methylase UbiE
VSAATDFDPAAFKLGQRNNWNNLSSGWDKWYDLFESGAAPANRTLLEDAGVSAGHSVLDIGCGTGQPALAAAELAGPRGRVIGIDLAEEMLAVARRRAAELSLKNVEFVECDAESIDFGASSFDAVISRFGLMFLPDVDTTLRRSFDLLRPGGALTAAVWGAPPQVPFMSLAFGVAATRLELDSPAAGLPGPFSMANPGGLQEGLRRAGFADVTHKELRLVFTPDSAAEFAEFSWDLLPGRLRGELAARFGDERDPDTWNAVIAKASEFETGQGNLAMPCTCHCVRAVKPA